MFRFNSNEANKESYPNGLGLDMNCRDMYLDLSTQNSMNTSPTTCSVPSTPLVTMVGATQGFGTPQPQQQLLENGWNNRNLIPIRGCGFQNSNTNNNTSPINGNIHLINQRQMLYKNQQKLQQLQQQRILQQQQQFAAAAMAQKHLALAAAAASNQQEDEISKSLKMFAMLAAYKAGNEPPFRHPSPVDLVMQEFADNGYVSDDPNHRHNSRQSPMRFANNRNSRTQWLQQQYRDQQVKKYKEQKYRQLQYEEQQFHQMQYEEQQFRQQQQQQQYEEQIYHRQQYEEQNYRRQQYQQQPYEEQPYQEQQYQPLQYKQPQYQQQQLQFQDIQYQQQQLQYQRQLPQYQQELLPYQQEQQQQALPYQQEQQQQALPYQQEQQPQQPLLYQQEQQQQALPYQQEQQQQTLPYQQEQQPQFQQQQYPLRIANRDALNDVRNDFWKILPSRTNSHHRSYQMAAKHCVFCENNKEPEAVVKSHAVRDLFGRVLCPKLRTYICPICQASGDMAHTIKYCPQKPIITMDDAVKAESFRLAKAAYFNRQMKF